MADAQQSAANQAVQNQPVLIVPHENEQTSQTWPNSSNARTRNTTPNIEAGTVIVAQTIPKLSRNPQPMVCLYCRENMCTVVNYEWGKTTLAAMAIGLFGGCCCMCLLPLCFTVFDDAEHRCSKCGQHVGTAKIWK